MSKEENFWKRVDVVGSDECWEWKSHLVNGYGRFSVRPKHVMAHRFSWILANGDIPKGLEVCHKCDNKKCVNPNHLFLGTHRDNEQDKVSKGRQAKGRINGQSGNKSWSNVLSETDVLSIRQSKDSGSSLSKLYKVSQQTICDIRHNRSWSWLS